VTARPPSLPAARPTRRLSTAPPVRLAIRRAVAPSPPAVLDDLPAALCAVEVVGSSAAAYDALLAGVP